MLKGRRFINLDSEAEGSLWISCAGGLSGISHIPVQRMEAEGEKLQIKICGLMGGHSGAEIDKKRANANVLMGRFFYGLKKQTEYQIVSLAGGQKDRCDYQRVCGRGTWETTDKTLVKEFAEEFQKNLREEYAASDEGITVAVEEFERFQGECASSH